MRTATKFQNAVLAVLLSVFAGTSHAVDQTSLGLNGCDGRGLATNSDASFTLAACYSARGLYYSTNFGTSWTFAAGGSYTYGHGLGAAIIGNSAYAVANVALYRMDIAPSDTWTPSWEFLLAGVNDIATRGSFLVAARANPFYSGNTLLYTNSIEVLNGATGEVVTSSALPIGNEIQVAAVDVAANYVYATVFLNPDRGLYRASFNESTGAIGTWEIVDATGYSGYAGVCSPIVEPASGRLYCGGGNYFSPELYQSDDQADTFQQVTVPGTYDGVAEGVTQGIFSGSTYVLGGMLSTNGGTNWTDLPALGIVSTPGSDLTGNLALADPNSIEHILHSTDVGFAVTSDLITNSGAPTWATANSGLTARAANKLALASTDAAYAIAGTGSGIAASVDFGADPTHWTHPLCSSDGCDSISELAFKATDKTVAFVSTKNKLRKLDITVTDGVPSGTFSLFGPSDLLPILVQTSEFLPGKVVVGTGLVGTTYSGGLHFLDDTTGAAVLSKFPGKVLRTFIALSSSVMFAGFRGLTDEASERGIYRSTDGGENWTRMESDVFTDLVSPSSMAYDSVNDILYVGTWADNNDIESNNSNIYALDDALAGGIDWRAPTTPIDLTNIGAGIVDVAVNSSTGAAYAGVGNRIFFSNDKGVSWTFLFALLPGEAVSSIDVALVAQSTAVGSLATANRLVVGSSTGLYRIDSSSEGGNPGEEPEDEVGACTLTIGSSCAANKVKRNKKCTFTSSLANAATLEPIGGAKFKIERKIAGGKWLVQKSAETNDAGTKNIKLNISANASYRAKFSSPACTTTVLKKKVKN